MKFTGGPRALVPILALLAVALAGPPDAAADQRDPRLPGLLAALAEASDPEQALPIEGAIWGIWLDGGDRALNELMARGVEAMGANRLRDAAERFTELILAAPEFAEAWNKRATVYYLMDRYEDSVRDIKRTLALEPRHFGAISGMGLIFLERGDEEGALGAFEKVLEIHPRARRGCRAAVRNHARPDAHPQKRSAPTNECIRRLSESGWTHGFRPVAGLYCRASPGRTAPERDVQRQEICPPANDESVSYRRKP